MRPLEKLDLEEGEKVEIVVRKKGIFGLMNGRNADSQALKNELREING
ncbi:MAG: DUF104 domain-containing protein [Methanotrichaceae archaeon]|nr:DUF104 domain-containing protein [Methanotrichaceae archaeon]